MIQRTPKRLGLCAALIVCNLVFIWGNSLLPGEISGALSQWLRELLAPLFGQGPESQGSGLLRKLAHFTEFACLGALLGWLFAMLRGKPAVSLPLLLAFAAAGIDETIQRFVPDRGPSLWDVALDTCGAAVGIFLLLAGHSIRKKTKIKTYLEETK